MTGKKTLKRSLIKGSIIFILFITTFIILLYTEAPAYFDSYVYYKDFKLEAYFALVGYRFVLYMLFPLIITFFEMLNKEIKILNKEKKKSYRRKLLIENFNIQFCTYFICAGLYTLLGFDKYLGVNLFNSADTFLFITAFVFKIIIEKKLPNPLEIKDNDL